MAKFCDKYSANGDKKFRSSSSYILEKMSKLFTLCNYKQIRLFNDQLFKEI